MRWIVERPANTGGRSRCDRCAITPDARVRPTHVANVICMLLTIELPLLVAQAMEEADDDLADVGQVAFEGRLRRRVRQAALEADAEVCRHRHELPAGVKPVSRAHVRKCTES